MNLDQAVPNRYNGQRSADVSDRCWYTDGQNSACSLSETQMSTITKQTVVPLWHYHCPECGFSDREFGDLAVTDAIYCEVCLEDKHHVRLKRWQADEQLTNKE